MEMTMATIGWLTKNLDIVIHLFQLFSYSYFKFPWIPVQETLLIRHSRMLLAGIQSEQRRLDARLRGHDGHGFVRGLCTSKSELLRLLAGICGLRLGFRRCLQWFRINRHAAA